MISNPNLLLPIITTETQEPLIQRVRGRETQQIFFVGPWFTDVSNTAWQNWPYFRYLVYRLIAESASSQNILSFAQYPLSPIPQGYLRLGIALSGVSVVLLSAGIFYRTQRYLYMHPDILETSNSALVAPRTPSRWDTTGFHRHLAGFLGLMTIMLVTLVPTIRYYTHTLPNILIPWSQPLRFWELVTTWSQLAWVFFDLSIGVAVTRSFAVLRPHRLDQAFHNFQFYMWWQLLSSAILFGATILLTIFVFPGTNLAHLSFYFVIHALIWFPGFLKVFTFFFRANMRLDYEQLATATLTIGTLIIQSISVPLFKRWGAMFPAIGETIGSIVGLGIGLYLAQWLSFGIGAYLYRRMGYTLRSLVLPGFKQGTSRRILGFGAWITLGKLAMLVGAIIQGNLLVDMLVNYNQVQSSVTVLLYIVAIYDALSAGLYPGLMPALAEAMTLNYQFLVRYYVGQGIHYGVWFSLFFLSTFGAVAERIIVGTFGSAFVDSATWIIPLLIWGGTQWMIELPDRVLVAANRPALPSWVILGEQGLRIGLMLILVPRWQLFGVALAYVLARAFRIVVSWILTQHLTVTPHIYSWQTFVAPIAAAILVYNLLRLGSALWWMLIPRPNLIYLLIIIFPALVVYSFFSAFFGGWDDEGIAEFKRASQISGVGAPLAWLLLISVRTGAKVSPLHGRFPMALRGMAQEEAQTLALKHTARE